MLKNEEKQRRKESLKDQLKSTKSKKPIDLKYVHSM
jgi:hypothetical protein